MDKTPDRSAWSHYWASAPLNARGCLPGLPRPVAEAFEVRWSDFFSGLATGDRVLDLGTGDGAVLRFASSQARGFKLVGVDYADHLPASSPDTEFFSGVNFEALPFPNHSFDAVTSQFSIEYAGDDAVSELLRVLKPEGALMIVAHHSNSAVLDQNRRRLAALDELMEDGGLVQAVEGLVNEGSARDPSRLQGLAAMLQALRRKHEGQGIIEEIATGAARLMGQPHAARELADVRAQAGMEQLRLRALNRAALDEQAVAALAKRLTQPQRSVEYGVLSVPNSNTVMAWHLVSRANPAPRPQTP